MKKKIFITGEVREFDSANPQKLADEISPAILNERAVSIGKKI